MRKAKPQTIAVTVRRDKKTGRPVLFFVNENPRGYWLECYDRIGQHSECSHEYMIDRCSRITRTMADYAETVERLAQEWGNIGPDDLPKPRIVSRLTYPRGKRYIGNC